MTENLLANTLRQSTAATSLSAPLDLTQIYEAECSNVWNSLRRLGIPEPDLADVTHDVFVAAIHGIGGYDPSRPIRRWLFGISVRLASDFHRRGQKRQSAAAQTNAELKTRPSTPERILAASQIRQCVLRALDKSPFERRVVLVMHDLEGYSAPEIAESLSIPLNTVYSRLRASRIEVTAELKRMRSEGTL